jgi:hypothetical protein
LKRETRKVPRNGDYLYAGRRRSRSHGDRLLASFLRLSGKTFTRQ